MISKWLTVSVLELSIAAFRISEMHERHILPAVLAKFYGRSQVLACCEIRKGAGVERTKLSSMNVMRASMDVSLLSHCPLGDETA